MTDPLKLAEFLHGHGGGDVCLDDLELRLIAAALRLAEADTALIDNEDAKPMYPKVGEMTKWSDDRDVLIGRHRDAEDAYRSAREGVR